MRVPDCARNPGGENGSITDRAHQNPGSGPALCADAFPASLLCTYLKRDHLSLARTPRTPAQSLHSAYLLHFVFCALFESVMARHDPSLDRLVPSNAEHRYDISASDLPLSCPMPGMHLWNSHPRVYLSVEANGSVRCPYCGAQFTLKGDAGHSH